MDPFHRVGNDLAIDFANTRYAPDHADGSLRSARDVVAFLVATGALSAREASELRRSFTDDVAATRFLRKALNLRATIARVLDAIEQRRPADDDDLAALNELLRADAGFQQVRRRSGASYELIFRRMRADLGHVLAPVARATAALLSAPHPPVRTCAGRDCIRRFYDDSRTGRRRWCDMAACGNRAKVSAFQERKRVQRT